MRLRYQRLLVAMAVVAAIAFLVPTAFAQCVSGTSVAEFQDSGPFAGYYKYTITFTWDTPQGLSNVTLDCGFGECPEEACSQTFLFDTPAGTTDGVPAPCVVEYSGEFNCEGNPSIGLNDPIIKWDAINTEECEPGPTGSGVLCFYSNLGPSPESQLPMIIIKDGQDVCEGTIEGDCPTPPCLVPVEQHSWGKVKALLKGE